MPGITDTNAAPDVFGGWCVDRSRIDDVASINIRVVVAACSPCVSPTVVTSSSIHPGSVITPTIAGRRGRR